MSMEILVVYDETNLGIEAKGATLRAVSRSVEEIKLKHGNDVTVKYVSATIPDPSAAPGEKTYLPNPELLNYVRTKNTVAICVRSQFPEMVTVVEALKAKGVKTFFHLADPHAENEEPKMQPRAKAHRHLMRICDGIIATSQRLVEVARRYNKNIEYIPNAVDCHVLALSPDVSFTAHAARGVTGFVAGYPHQHPAMTSYAYAMLAYNRMIGQADIPDIFQIDAGKLAEANIRGAAHKIMICTQGTKKPTEEYTHAPASGAAHIEHLRYLNAQFPQHVILQDTFSYKAMDEMQRAADLTVLPPPVQAELTPFQNLWFKHRGADRALASFGRGKAVCAGGRLSAEHLPLIDAGAIIFGKTFPDMFQQIETISSLEAAAKIEAGMNHVRRRTSSAVVAGRYFEMFQKHLGVAA